MNWQEILTILVPLFALLGWMYNRIDKRFEKMDARFDKVDARFDKVDARFDKVEEKLQKLDNRLTRLEGRFDERGYWESREYHKTGTEDKK
jgi:predicted nuclease with TOPRIM domain